MLNTTSLSAKSIVKSQIHIVRGSNTGYLDAEVNVERSLLQPLVVGLVP